MESRQETKWKYALLYIYIYMMYVYDVYECIYITFLRKKSEVHYARYPPIIGSV